MPKKILEQNKYSKFFFLESSEAYEKKNSSKYEQKNFFCSDFSNPIQKRYPAIPDNQLAMEIQSKRAP